MEGVKKRLQADAAQLRKIYLDKPVRKSNVAILELHLTNGTIIGTGATSKLKSPTPKPKKQSEGGSVSADYRSLFGTYNGYRCRI